MVKIGSCTVVYNPDSKVLQNLESYSHLMEVSVVVDNSDTKNDISRQLQKNHKMIYIDMHKNAGIAAALNAGISYLSQKDLDFVLTMDQDSVFPTKYYSNIIQLIEKYKTEYSIIGLNFNHENEASNIKIIDVPYWLTSGNFVNIQDFMRVGGFRKDLFIDFVDFEFGYFTISSG